LFGIFIFAPEAISAVIVSVCPLPAATQIGVTPFWSGLLTSAPAVIKGTIKWS